MAAGLPVEGEEGPFLGDRLAEVTTVEATGVVADARRALDRSGGEPVVVVHADLAVGEVDAEALEGRADGDPLLDVLRPVPTAVRPSVAVEAAAADGGGTLLVTTAEGRLLGRATVEAADHDHHPHDSEGSDGDGGDGSVDPERFESELSELMDALEERFGDGEPSPDELRDFLRERLEAEGRSAEDADRLLVELERSEGR